MTLRVLLLAAAALCLQAQSPIERLPPAARWMSHLTDELLPFWTVDAALGNPLGAFPTTRCDDGSLINYDAPCPEVASNAWLMNDRGRYLVALSRQTYGYGVAFHMTGDPKYLDYMRAGVRYIRENAIDRGGGMATRQEVDGTWGPQREFRNPQELAYGLLGLSFYYYLTRDPEVLTDILTARDWIFSRYRDPVDGALNWVLAPNGGDLPEHRRLVAQLDQLNAYLVLLIPILPEPHQSEWKRAARDLAYLIKDRFYSPAENVMFLNATTPEDLDLTRNGTDFGHTIKSMWMMRMVGMLTGDDSLVQFVEQNAPRVLERAYIASSGSWASGLRAGGELDPDKSWWIFCELDQFAASLALRRPEAARYLPQTYDYWLRYFVDPVGKEVWTGVDAATNRPQPGQPKAWPWKNAYHSFEHALVAYLTTKQLHGEPVTLYYAFPTVPGMIRPYFYSGDIVSIDPVDGPVWAVKFRDLDAVRRRGEGRSRAVTRGW